MVTTTFVETRPALAPATPSILTQPNHILHLAVAEYLQFKEADKTPPNTLAAQKYDLGRLERYWGNREGLPVVDEIETYLTSLHSLVDGEPLSPASKQRHRLTIRALINWGVESDKYSTYFASLAYLEAKGMPFPRYQVTSSLTEGQVTQLIQSAYEGKNDPQVRLRDAALMGVGFYAGARVEELVHLTTADVVGGKNGVAVNLNSRKGRVGMITNEPVTSWIREYQESLDGKGSFFRSRNHLHDPNSFLTRPGLWLIVKGYGKAMNMLLSPKMFRNYFLTQQPN